MSGEFPERYGSAALVTGASSGIGEAFAEELAERGFDLVLSARRVDRLEALADRLRAAHGTKADIVPADLVDPDAPARIVDACARHDIGLVVSNAAATKALTVSLCEGLWAELRPCGVDVLAMCPGATESEATVGSGHLPASVLASLQPAREAAALTLDNIANGPTYIPSERYRAMFEALLAQPRREALIGMERRMRNMA